MVTVLALLGVLLVLAAAAVLSTRDEPLLADAPRDAADVPLPDGPLAPEDVAELRFSLAPRGYRMAEVDLALERLQAELADRDRRIALLEAAAEGAQQPTEVREATPADLPVTPPPAPVVAPVMATAPVEPSPVGLPPVPAPSTPVEQPAVEQPVMEQPVMEQPVMEQPPVEQPPVEQPPVEQPVVEPPVLEEPPPPPAEPPALAPAPAAYEAHAEPTAAAPAGIPPLPPVSEGPTTPTAPAEVPEELPPADLGTGPVTEQEQDRPQ